MPEYFKCVSCAMPQSLDNQLLFARSKLDNLLAQSREIKAMANCQHPSRLDRMTFEVMNFVSQTKILCRPRTAQYVRHFLLVLSANPGVTFLGQLFVSRTRSRWPCHIKHLRHMRPLQLNESFCKFSSRHQTLPKRFLAIFYGCRLLTNIDRD